MGKGKNVRVCVCVGGGGNTEGVTTPAPHKNFVSYTWEVCEAVIL